MGCSPWDRKESGMSEWITLSLSLLLDLGGITLALNSGLGQTFGVGFTKVL